MKALPYTDPRTGFTFPDAVWMPADIWISHENQSIRITWQAWPSIAHLAGGAPIAGAVRRYWVTGHDYLARLFGPLGAAIVADAYAVAAATKDVPDPEAPGDPARMTGFFDSATEVPLPAPAGSP